MIAKKTSGEVYQSVTTASEIENIITTIDRLFQFRELHAQADPPTKEALRYSHALLRVSATHNRRDAAAPDDQVSPALQPRQIEAFVLIKE